jgi:acyl-CoA reductase-like NAD-dependent aldehyde dehydrogenase
LSLWIAGEWIDTEEQQPVKNKYNGKVIGHVSVATREHISTAVQSGRKAMKENPIGPERRSEILLKTAALIHKNHGELAQLIAQEGGKPLKEALVEVSRAVRTFTVSAEEAKRVHGEMVPIATADVPGKLAFTVRVPVGVVCAISPFNFPINLVAHKIAPAFAAGNAFVLKPASYTPLTAIRLCQLMEEAGLPKGYGHLVIGGGSTVGEWLLEEQGFAFYTFTGSPMVGKHLKERIGLRRCTLELGSNSATLIHSDADIQYAAQRCAKTAFGNAGQICISVQRVFVQESKFDEFLEAFVAATKSLKVGDPSDAATDVGPMIQLKEAERAESWIQEAIQSGAVLRLGGTRNGAMIDPTILTDVAENQNVCCQEAFAPLVIVNRYDSLDDGIAQVNRSKYGLQGGLFTSSLEVMMRCAREIEVGGLMVNETSAYRSDEMPYGGVKESGIGREGPKYTIEEMTESKLIVIH